MADFIGVGSDSDSRVDTLVAIVIARIDEANARDPEKIPTPAGLRPKELVHGERATAWLARRDPAATAAQQVAARGHHICRWELPRADFPEGRAGYLKWRATQKKRHAERTCNLMAEAGFDAAQVDEAGRIIRKEGLGTSSAAQVHEDTLCLVFLELQFEGFARAQGSEKTADIVRKTAAKMSEEGLALVEQVGLSDESMAQIVAALAAQ